MSRLVTALRQNALAFLALFILLGGTAFAATQLPKNSVGKRQIKKKAVTYSKLSPGVRARLQPASGDEGAVGPTGSQGPSGTAGATGTRGERGPQGDPGARGEQGRAGEAGPVGPSGPAGPTGDRGPHGDAGPTGARGADGEAGPTGPRGPDGQRGPAGDEGPTGPRGQQGAPGPTGIPGPTGPQGSEGDRGPTGTAGVAGTGFTWRGSWNTLTPYAPRDVVAFAGASFIAVAENSANAPAGSPAWELVAARGDDGLTGPRGVAGPTGPTGAAGPTGPSGASGPTGLQGPPGASSGAWKRYDDDAVLQGVAGTTPQQYAWIASPKTASVTIGQNELLRAVVAQATVASSNFNWGCGNRPYAFVQYRVERPDGTFTPWEGVASTVPTFGEQTSGPETGFDETTDLYGPGRYTVSLRYAIEPQIQNSSSGQYVVCHRPEVRVTNRRVWFEVVTATVEPRS